MLIPPGLLEGQLAQVYVRSYGAWDTWTTRSEGNIALPSNREAGDQLFVYISGEAASEVSNSGWTKLNETTGWVTQLWARRASGDSNDNFVAPVMTIVGAVQMVVIAGLDWSNTASLHQQTTSNAYGANLTYNSVPDGTFQDTLVITATHKVWSGPPTGVDMPSFGALAFEASTGYTLMNSEVKLTGDNDFCMVWGFRYDDGNPTVAASGNYGQDPLDTGSDVGVPYNGINYKQTLRVYDTPGTPV